MAVFFTKAFSVDDFETQVSVVQPEHTFSSDNSWERPAARPASSEELPATANRNEGSTTRPVYTNSNSRPSTTTRRPTTTTRRPPCVPSITEVSGRKQCKGALIFDEPFDDEFHRRWSTDVAFPSATGVSEARPFTSMKATKNNAKMRNFSRTLSSSCITMIQTCTKLRMVGCTSRRKYSPTSTRREFISPRASNLSSFVD